VTDVVPVTPQYEYLGMLFHFTTSLVPACEHTVIRVRKKRNVVARPLTNTSWATHIRIQLVKSVVFPVSTYGGEVLGMPVNDHTLFASPWGEDDEPPTECADRGDRLPLMSIDGNNLGRLTKMIPKIQKEVDVAVAMVFRGVGGSSTRIPGSAIDVATWDSGVFRVAESMAGLRARATVKYQKSTTDAFHMYSHAAGVPNGYRSMLWAPCTRAWMEKLRGR